MNTDNNSAGAERNDSAESEEDSSFVTKVRSRVSGLFNNSISRLFGSPAPERRKNEDELSESQPPSKRPKRNDEFAYEDNSVNHGSRNFLNTPNINEPGPSRITHGTIPQNIYTKALNNNNLVNGGVEKDSDSGESTSGYSSMARINQEITRQQFTTEHKDSKKSMNNSKRDGNKRLFNISTPEVPNRSLFGAESLSPQEKNTSLSSRRPSFNSSSFSSPNFVDRTLTTSRIVNSPFYNGPTTYGGASAYDRRHNELRSRLLKNTIQVRPVNRASENNPCTSLSKTARRILDTLEQYSSTLSSDVKKIPPPTKVEKKEGVFTKYTGVNPYTVRRNMLSNPSTSGLNNSKPSTSGYNKELLVPTVPELLRMKEKIKIQDATDKIRKIATSSNVDNNVEYNPCEAQQKHTNKMKTKVSSVRAKAPTSGPSIQIVQDVQLTPVPLTLPENKLPKFDMVIPPPSSSKTIETVTTVTNKSSEKCTEDQENVQMFKFSKPVIISSLSNNLKSLAAINNFKFSEPVSKKHCSRKSEKQIEKPSDDSLKTFTKKNDECTIGNKMERDKSAACSAAAPLKSANPSTEPSNNSTVIVTVKSDTLNKFKMPSDEWECQSCYVRNKNASTKCVACGTAKPGSAGTGGSGDMSSSKPDPRSWECESCSKRNKWSKTADCEACETAKQRIFSVNKTTSSTTTPASSSKWECPTCLVRNDSGASSCPCCETPKPGSGGSVNSSGAALVNKKWECPTCMVKNDSSASSCPCCETPKPGGGSSGSTTGATLANKKWECPTCMVRNDSSASSCPCCDTPKPGGGGVTLVNKNTVNLFNFGVGKTQFSFGIPPADNAKTEQSDNVGFKLGDSNATSTPFATATPFKFGLDKVETKTETPPSKTAESFNIVAPNPVATSERAPSIPAVKPETEKVATSSIPTFKFGAFNTDKTETKDEKSGGFGTVGSSATTLPTFQFAPSSVATKTAPPAPMFKFGEFKANTTTNPATETSSITTNSGGTNSSTSSAAGLFTFSSQNLEKPKATTTNTTPMFPFGKPTNAVESLNFAAPSPAAPLKNDDSSKLFAFGARETAAPVPAANDSLKNGGFNFGNPTVGNGNNNSKAAVFSFGATSSSNIGSGGFNFQAPESSSSTSGGFKFSTTPAVPTFDANAKPSFNFTGNSIPTFSATPSELSSGGQPTRRIRKAVRRIAPR